MSTKEKKLNLKQQLFADWYIKLMHVTNAAIKAGYSKKTAYSIGSELLKKPEIQEYIQKRKEELEDLLGLNKATVLQDFIAIKDRSMQAVPLMYYNPKEKEYVQKMEMNDEGDEVGVYQYDSIGANRALENINKMMGYNAPEKAEIENKTPVQVNVSVVKKYAADAKQDA